MNIEIFPSCVNHPPQRPFSDKSQLIMQRYRLFVIAVDSHTHFLVSQFFKVISRDQLNGLGRIPFSLMLANYADAIAECAVTMVAAMSPD
jgi:hypothetical protein